MISKMTHKIEAFADKWTENEDIGLSEESKKRLADFYMGKVL